MISRSSDSLAIDMLPMATGWLTSVVGLCVALCACSSDSSAASTSAGSAGRGGSGGVSAGTGGVGGSIGTGGNGGVSTGSAGTGMGVGGSSGGRGGAGGSAGTAGSAGGSGGSATDAGPDAKGDAATGCDTNPGYALQFRGTGDDRVHADITKLPIGSESRTIELWAYFDGTDLSWHSEHGLFEYGMKGGCHEFGLN